MTLHPAVDGGLLEQLVLGKVPADDADRLAAQFADDDRVAQVALALADYPDTLLERLRDHCPPADADTEPLVDRLLTKLRGAGRTSFPVSLDSPTLPTPHPYASPTPVPEALLGRDSPPSLLT